MVKAKYNRGRNLRLPQRWVFGIYDTVQKLGYIVFVTDRSAQTLLPIIERVVRPGSIIHSDGWGAYDRIMTVLAHRNYQHHVVNHSREFVAANGTHTQAIEAYWMRAKAIFKRMNGTQEPLVAGYLDEVMWRERYGGSVARTLRNILLHMRERNPC